MVDIITKLTAENAPSIPTSCALHDAADTGLESESADAVIGEAMLTMQTERGKRAIIAESLPSASAGGTYSIHELGLQPDDLPEPVKDEVRKALAPQHQGQRPSSHRERVARAAGIRGL